MFERNGPEDLKREARRAQQEANRRLKEHLEQRDQRLRHELGRQTAMLQQRSAVSDEAREYLAANSHYTQLVMVVGYGAFFTLWVQTKGLMSGWLFASTGLLITTSLLVFIAVELIKAYIQGRYLPRVVAGTMSQGEYQEKIGLLMGHWLWTFILSVATGLTAGCSLFFWFLYRTIVEGGALIQAGMAN